ncbi:hypothetical protein P3342_001450 [Pyrenophora teres f. teres]|nr:hypothetical protein P3342_001450 [Pyrenophora teres f. teres]
MRPETPPNRHCQYMGDITHRNARSCAEGDRSATTRVIPSLCARPTAGSAPTALVTKKAVSETMSRSLYYVCAGLLAMEGTDVTIFGIRTEARKWRVVADF